MAESLPMRILLLTPEPFFQDRGTPIAVSLILKALSEHGAVIDQLAYHEGEDLSYPNVTLFRIPRIPFVRNVRPGFSLKKLICDMLMFFKALGLVIRRRPRIVHAVEEAVFFAWFFKAVFSIPYVYDMDSVMSQQVVEKMPRLSCLSRLMGWFEGCAIRRAVGVIAVCDALAETARGHGAKNVAVLRDISLLDVVAGAEQWDVRREHRIDGAVFMYVGNLEEYQGIDLLLEGFARAADECASPRLVIAGGSARHIEQYRKVAGELGIAGKVHFIGPQPLKRLASLLGGADVLVSPRISGRNTPMKIYSYLDSGKAVLATDLPTHTQVLSSDIACLVPPEPDAFARAILKLAGDEEYRLGLGSRGRAAARERYSYEVFRRTLTDFYDELGKIVGEVRKERIDRPRPLRSAPM